MFLHALEEGPASRSYGLQVAQLAGVPGSVIRAARRKLGDLESAATPQGDLFSASSSAAPAMAPTVENHPVVEVLHATDPDALSPREAQALIYRLKDMLAPPDH